MADKEFHPKTDGPESRHEGSNLRDLNPQADAGQNFGRVGPHPEKDDPPTAFEVKEAHRLLNDFNDADLKQMPVLPPGSRLEQGATYVDLRDPERKEFTARGEMPAVGDELYVPKSEVHYEVWNRLIAVATPDRVGGGGATRG